METPMKYPERWAQYSKNPAWITISIYLVVVLQLHGKLVKIDHVCTTGEYVMYAWSLLCILGSVVYVLRIQYAKKLIKLIKLRNKLINLAKKISTLSEQNMYLVAKYIESKKLKTPTPDTPQLVSELGDKLSELNYYESIMLGKFLELNSKKTRTAEPRK
jgi:hypothetical protein